MKIFDCFMYFDENPLTVSQIDKIIKNKRTIYDLNVDKTANKIGSGKDLKKFDINKLPIYIQENLNTFKKRLD